MMSRFRPFWLASLGLIALLPVRSAITAQPLEKARVPSSEVDFESSVAPIFRNRCFACHSEIQQMGGLRLDRSEDALRGGVSGAVIHPGDSAGSKLIRMVTGVDEGSVMPLGGEPLTPEQVSILRAWIDQGANWKRIAPVDRAQPQDPRWAHWSFQPIRRPSLPGIENPAWIENEIDAFVLARLEREGIAPSPEADRGRLIRRLSLDIIGLPPSPNQVTAFLADDREDAYDRLVERLLQSPHYGEKWSRYWQDLVRYADSEGYAGDDDMPHMWRYREWLVNALNRDMPFDQFTVQQLAGDLLPNATVEERTATGFYRCGPVNREAGVDLEESRFEQVVDRTRAVGDVWLGLSVGCAQCHDHKYDPISQKDFYRLFAFFDRTEDVQIDAPLPGQLGPYLRGRPQYEKRLQELLDPFDIPELQAEWERNLLQAKENPGADDLYDYALTQFGEHIKVVEIPPAARTRRQRQFLTRAFIGQYSFVLGPKRYKKSGFEKLQKDLAALDAEFPRVAQAMVVRESPHAGQTHVAVRGNYKHKGDPVSPGTPAVLPPLPSGHKKRLMLARWLVSDENPLTARVMVNRVWQELFGRGLVLTSENLGIRGEEPSHPELLEELAYQFRARGWSFKRLIRQIVTSSTYRQSSDVRPELVEKDPGNTLLARQARLRLAGELVRDSTLAVSGLLNTRVGGPTVRPPLPAGAGDFLTNPVTEFWTETTGPDRYRRGIYIHFKRLLPYPQLSNFDAPEGAESCSRRERSNTPLQALNLLNDPVFFEAAQALAVRILVEAPPHWDDRMDYAFQLCMSRHPAAQEVGKMRAYFQERVQTLQDEPEWASAILPNRFDGVDPVRAAAWVGVGQTLLNLDEFLTRE